MSRRRCAFLAASIVLVPSCVVVLAQTPGSDPSNGDVKEPVWQPSERIITLFPSGDVYPVYVADPHRPTSAILLTFYPQPRIPNSSSPRMFLAGGGHFGIVRIDANGARGRHWQVSIDAGFDAIFDSQYKNDGIGWDGNYGLTVTTTSRGSPLGFRAALLHQSAHLGDEYAERTSARRINYTREELALGYAWRFRPRWRTYGEIGIAYVMRSDVQETWRWQAGLEYEARPTVFGGRMALYGAMDLSALEERDWRLDIALQGGLVTRSSGRTYRIFAEWYDGRVKLGQFSRYSEATLSIGFKVDL